METETEQATEKDQEEPADHLRRTKQNRKWLLRIEPDCLLCYMAQTMLWCSNFLTLYKLSTQQEQNQPATIQSTTMPQ